MKTKTLAPLLALLLAAATTVSMAAGPNGNGNGPGRSSGRNNAAAAQLTTEEAATLLWMHEEEKLARDVYQNLADTWQAVEFRNIARSEQRHFDALGSNVSRFGQIDTALPETGQFTNPELQELYYTLLTSGNASYVDALRVGATIEDLDISDLLTAINATNNATLKLTYGHLLEGSKNHLRVFVARLAAQGVAYEPQYIDPVLFDAIIGQ